MAYEYLTSTGAILADTSDLLAEVQSEWQATFASDLVVTSDTPQGVLIAQETQARSNVQQNNALTANQLNPNLSGGIFLESICAFLGLQRQGASPTVVPNVTVTGVSGTVIPIGSQAYTSGGQYYETTVAVTIPSGGSTTVNFQCTQTGPIACAPTTLTHIAANSAVLGWETVSNSSEACRDLQGEELAGKKRFINK